MLLQLFRGFSRPKPNRIEWVPDILSNKSRHTLINGHSPKYKAYHKYGKLLRKKSETITINTKGIHLSNILVSGYCHKSHHTQLWETNNLKLGLSTLQKFSLDQKHELEGEIFKEIPEFDNITKNGAKVSNYGRILKEKKAHVEVSYGRPTDKGYKRACIGGRTYNMHTLVAETFRASEKTKLLQGIACKKLHVDHIDQQRSNNRAENLQWLTPEDHGKKTACTREKSYKSSGTCTPVLLVCKTAPIESLSFPSVISALKYLEIPFDRIAKHQLKAYISKLYRRPIRGYHLMRLTKTSLPGEKFRRFPVNLHSCLNKSWTNSPSASRCVYVSNMGRIRYQNGRISIGNKSHEQEIRPKLMITIGGKCLGVHRLVAETWQRKEKQVLLEEGCELKDLVVVHRDKCTTNNEASNLEWKCKRHVKK